jgi:hypothetical protein
MKKNLTDDMFHEALDHEDELGSVLRVHLHVEYYIDEILHILIPFPEDLKYLSLDYNGKIHLICALGVKVEYKSILLALGKIRNNFAHDPFYKIDNSTINNLYKTLPEESKEILQKSYKKFQSQLQTDKSSSYKSLPPKEQFTLIAIIIRRIVIRIRDESNNVYV